MRKPNHDGAGRRASATETLSPGVPLDQIGETLAAFYDSLVAEGVPEHLAALVRKVRQAEPDIEPAEAARSMLPVVGERIALIVEDERELRELAASLLDETELVAIGCDSAEAALEVLRIRGGEVALVFADVRLAGAMNGIQLAHAIATLWPRARLVLTSGHGLDRPALPPEAVFIPKPWRPRDVLAEVERASGELPPAVL